MVAALALVAFGPLVLLLAGCGGADEPAAVVAPIRVLPLAGPMSLSAAEISGMDWHGDLLLMLPQYPEIFSDLGDQSLFGLHRAELVAAVDGAAAQPLVPFVLPLDAPWIRESVSGYQGREAIAVAGDRYFMTLELMDRGVMGSRLVGGRFLDGEPAPTLAVDHMVDLPLQTNLPALSYETLVVDGGMIV